ncbi:HAMP domain-containing sensor histidine kinase [Micrococcaceae bacterium Sec5.7]
MKPTDADQLILRAASRRVSIQIAAACAALVAVVIAASFLFVLRRSQPGEILEHAAQPGRIYIDSSDLLLALIGGGIVGIILAAAVGLISARRAVRPLGEALAAQRRFVQDASHELRTPLAVLDSRLQLANRQTTPGTPISDTVAQLRKDAAALTRTVNDLLLTATSETTRRPAEIVDAAELIAETVREMTPLADEAGVGLTVKSLSAAWVDLPAHTLRRVIYALVDNSLAHAGTGGDIAVTVTATGGKVRISVADNGSGITGIEPSRIFDRFAHGHPTGEGTQQRSHGIGLSLVREAAASRGGDARVTSTGPHGTIITVTLPERRRQSTGVPTEE